MGRDVLPNRYLGHLPSPDGVQGGLLKVVAELLQRIVTVQLGPEGQTSGPREYTCYWIGGRWLALLVLSPVPGYSTWENTIRHSRVIIECFFMQSCR